MEPDSTAAPPERPMNSPLMFFLKYVSENRKKENEVKVMFHKLSSKKKASPLAKDTIANKYLCVNDDEQ